MNQIITIIFIVLIPGIALTQIQTFQYDANGNQISKTVEGSVFTANIQGPTSACKGDSILLEATGGVSFQWDNGNNANILKVPIDSSTHFRVTVTDENGCTAQFVYWVEALPLPVPFSVNGDTISSSESGPVPYSVGSPSSGSTYLWSVEGGYIVSGYGTSEVTISWFADSLGRIEVVEQNNAGCQGEPQLLEVKLFKKQSIPLNLGWNLISTYLDLADPSPEAAFADIMPSLLKVKNIDEVFDPTAPPVFNTLSAVLAGEGYWVNVTQPSLLPLYGRPVNPASTAILLQPGWNLIGYTWPEPQNIESAFAEIKPQLEKVKDIFGSYDPDVPPVFNTLQNIEPGHGYWVKVSEALVFSFPPPNGNFRASELEGDEGSITSIHYSSESFWKAIAYPNSTIAYGHVTYNNRAVGNGAIVGAFVDEECRALGKVLTQSDSSIVSLVINGIVSEEVEFRLFLNGEFHTSDFTTQTQPGVPFADLLPITFQGQATILQEQGEFNNSAVEVFPNPFSKELHIRFSLKQKAQVLIKILNNKGEVVATIEDRLLDRGLYPYQWAAEGDYGVYFLQVQVGNEKIIEKIIHLK